MTTPTNTDTQFLNDYAVMQKAAGKLENALNAYSQEESALKTLKQEIDASVPAGASESELSSRVSLIEEYLNAGGLVQQAKSKVLNDQQTVRSDFETCANDISGNTSSTAADGSGGKQNLVNTALDLDQLLGSLTGTTSTDGSIQMAINGSVGPATNSTAYTSLDSIRQEIYLGDGDPFDPSISAGSDQTFIFSTTLTPGDAPQGCTIYKSFNDAWQAAQSTSGANTANSALKPISSAFGDVDQSYSSASAECNVEVQQIYSGLQTIITVEASVYKSITQIEQTVNQKVSG